jgi:hypothetical protein
VDDHIDLGSNQMLHPEIFTISTWVKVDANSAGNDHAGILSRLGTAEGGEYGYLLGITFNDSFGEPYPDFENYINFSVQDNSGVHHHHHSDFGIEFNQWYHIAATYDGSMSHLYINGIEQGTGIELPELSNNNEFNHIIGKWRHDPGAENNNPLEGSVDVVSIWNRSLTQVEILQSIYTDIGYDLDGVYDAGLIGYWSFDDAPGSQLIDLSGNRRIIDPVSPINISIIPIATEVNKLRARCIIK